MANMPYSGPPLRGTQGQTGGLPYIPALGPMGNAALPFMQMLFPAMNNISQLVTTQSPFERMQGMAYVAETQKMSGVGSAGARKALDTFMAIKDKDKRAAYLKNPDNAEAVFMGAQLVGGMTGMPNLADYIPGLEKQAMRGGVLRGMQFMEGAGIMASGGAAAKKFAGEMAGMQLNLSPTQRGEMFGEMGRRGLLQGKMTDSGMSPADTNRIKGQVKQWDKLLDGMKDIFGDQGSIKEMMDKLDQITQGSVAREGPAKMQKLVNSMKYLSATTGMSAQVVETIAAQGAHDAISMGLSGTAGAESAVRGMMVGDMMARSAAATGDMIWNAGNRASPEELGQAIYRRDLSFKASRSAIAAGGALAMIAQEAESRGLGESRDADGNLRKLTASELSAKVKEMGGGDKLQAWVAKVAAGDAETLRQLGRGQAKEYTDLMEKELGFSKSTMQDFMTKVTNAGQVYSDQINGTRAQSKELFKDMAPKLMMGVSAAKLTRGQVTGALEGMLDLEDLSGESVTNYLSKYLEGTGLDTDTAAKAAIQLNQQIRFATDKKAGGMGMDVTFGTERSQKKLKAREASFAVIDSMAKDIDKMFGSDTLARGAFEALFSGDKDAEGILEYVGKKSKNAKLIIKQVSPKMQRLSRVMTGLQADDLSESDRKKLEEEKAGLMTDINNAMAGLTDKDRKRIEEGVKARADEVKEGLKEKDGEDKNVIKTGDNTKIEVKSVANSIGAAVDAAASALGIKAAQRKVEVHTKSSDQDTGKSTGESTATINEVGGF